MLDHVSVPPGPSQFVDVCGVVRWFDKTKGYGFISQGNGGPDVLLHTNQLECAGYTIALEGARIECKALVGPTGKLKASEILSMDNSTALPPKTVIPLLEVRVVPVGDGFVRATCKWFDRVKGYGFLQYGEDTRDIRIHITLLKRYGLYNLLKPGQVIMVRFEQGAKGLFAVELGLPEP